MERLKRVVAKPAATKPATAALRLLLKSAEIEKLRGTGSHHHKQYPRRDRQSNQPAASGKAALFWLVGHALGPRKPHTNLAPKRQTESQISVKCVIIQLVSVSMAAGFTPANP
jgi:hypothetical protein